MNVFYTDSTGYSHSGDLWATWYVTPYREAEAERKEVRPVKSVFTVVVVSKKGEILLDKKVVAKDRDEALFEADVSSVLKAKGLKPGDVTMLAVKLGDVEIEPEPQKVQVVGKDA